MGFQQGLSGLNASSKALDSVGNNIANSNTVGFKSASTQFADVFAASLGGGGSQVGIGTSVAGIAQQFGQGNITVTSSPLDMAINGQGFFRLSNQGANTWTRNGQFNVNKDGFIVNTAGFRLTGYLANASNIIVPSTPADIFINTSDLQPQATGASGATGGVRMGLNLDSRAPVLGATPAFDFTDPTTYTSSTSVTVFDTLGNPHLMSLFFRKGDGGGAGTAAIVAAAAAIGTAASTAALAAAPAATAAEALAAATAASAAATAGSSAAVIGAAASAAILVLNATKTVAAAAASAAAIAATPVVSAPANTWQMYTSLDGGTTIGTDATGPTAMSFTTTGALSTPATGIIPQSFAITSGATTPLDFNINFNGSTQYGNTFGVNSIAQDGYTSGRLAGLSVASDGTIQGRYSNGQTRDLAQVVLGNFANPNGLASLGNNQWAETADSGQPLIGVPASGSLGALQSAAIEESNVDLTAELVQMITQQRVYQANAQTIKTQDQVLQTLVNLR